MGQAKRRGTLEQRIAQAQERLKIEAEEAIARHREAERLRREREQREREAFAERDGIPAVLVAEPRSARRLINVALVAAALAASLRDTPK